MHVELTCTALALALTACAHGGGAAAAPDYFTCPGVGVDDAAARLGVAGYALAERSPGAPAKTGWTDFDLAQGEAREGLSFRLEVVRAEGGVHFSVFEPSAQPDGVQWTVVTPEQEEDPLSRALLNKIRRDVCGTSDDFFTAR
jgi:hypothetical protein